jgi:hypothetical protein
MKFGSALYAAHLFSVAAAAGVACYLKFLGILFGT